MADHSEPEAGRARTQAGQRVEGMLDPLVRHQPTQHRDPRVLVRRGQRLQRRLGAVVHDRDAVLIDAEGDELAFARVRHRDVLAAAVEPRSQPRLDPPADAGAHRAVDDRPLLAVHMVHEYDDRGARDEAAEEREPVLHVDDRVEGPTTVTGEPPEGLGIDAELRPAADEPDTVAHLVGGCVGVCGAEHGDLVPGTDQQRCHALDIALGAATLGVGRVTPVEHEQAQWIVAGGHRESRYGNVQGAVSRSRLLCVAI